MSKKKALKNIERYVRKKRNNRLGRDHTASLNRESCDAATKAQHWCFVASLVKRLFPPFNAFFVAVRPPYLITILEQ